MTDHELTTRDLAGRSGTVDETADGQRTDSPRETDRTGMDRTAAGAELVQNGAQAQTSVEEPTELPRPQTCRPIRSRFCPDDQGRRFIERWQVIQASFVDEPRQSVEQADALVADLMQRLAAGFSSERERLEGQWDRGDDVSTRGPARRAHPVSVVLRPPPRGVDVGSARSPALVGSGPGSPAWGGFHPSPLTVALGRA